MPDRLPPRPAPAEEIITLLRRPKSGFVVYPNYIPKRMVDGRARFMTKCDMLVGPCACGYTHNEHDGWVRETLEYQNLRFEPLILWGEKQQRGMVVEIPTYWKEHRNWRRGRCDVLVGRCACGRIHSIQETWVTDQLARHGAVILNLPQPEGADVSESPPSPNRPNLHLSRDEVVEARVSFNRQSEDRIHRVGMPASNSSWWGEGGTRLTSSPSSPSPPSPPSPPTHSNVDVTPYEDWALPIELQEGVDNAEGVMGDCLCTTCGSRREVERQRALQEWVQTAQMVRDSLDLADSDNWSRDNCNEQGQAPMFCDCDDCCATRLRSRTTGDTRQTVPPPVLSNQARLIAHARSEGQFWSTESNSE
jgi:hypothetical protein